MRVRQNLGVIARPDAEQGFYAGSPRRIEFRQ
jgi:hypothetical protein